MQRPTGVTVIAVIDFIGSAILLILAVGAFVGATFLGAVLGRWASHSGSGTAGAGLGFVIGAMVGMVCIVIAVVAAVIGWGLWNLKDWARVVQIILSALGVFFRLIAVLGMMVHLHVLGAAWASIWLTYHAWVVFYLLQPQIKAAFLPAPVQPYIPPAAPSAQ